MKDNTVTIDVGEIENTCFVVMPLDSLFQTEYERVIRPAIEELGLKCIRGDEIYSKPNIMYDIWNSIRKCRLLIAELTNRNPNVFYEIGLAHAIGKPIILLTRDENDVPFDLKSLRYRYYDVNDPFWGDNLYKTIQSMVQNVLEQSEISSYLDGIKLNIQIPAKPQKVNVSPEVATTPTIDISGNWKAVWDDPDNPLEHQATVYITQQKQQLSATMTVTFIEEGEMSIVQQVLTGTIKEGDVNLNGVSYTYIQQGNSSAYNLDNFALKIALDGNSMHGIHEDEDASGQTTFTKLTSQT